MFAHKLSMYLKNDGALAFRHKIEGDIIPLLRKSSVIEGIPRIQTYEVLNSTIPRASPPLQYDNSAQLFPRPIPLAVPDKRSELTKSKIMAPRS
jgi:hypothetical protein